MLQSDAPKTRRLVLLVPPARLETLVAECRERCAHWRLAVDSLQARAIRPDEETYLRWARRDYIELALGLGAAGATLGGEVRRTQLRRSLIDVAIELGGGFPISCTPEATRAQTEACYPQLPGFLAEQRRIDPLGRWTSPWLRHQRSLLSRQSCEVKWGR